MLVEATQIINMPNAIKSQKSKHCSADALVVVQVA